VRVNGQVARASLRLRRGDRVEVELPAPEQRAPLEPETRALAIVYEDDAVLVLDKPAGLVVHPGAGVEHGTLVHALLHHHPAIAGVGGPDRPGIVHRLDKDTSGLLVVAKNARAHRVLVEALRRREVGRTYRALVWGDLPADQGEIDAPVGRDPRERKRMAVLGPVRRGPGAGFSTARAPGTARRGRGAGPAGRPALTRWRVLRRFGLATLLEVKLETGRTHQIRVHLAHVRRPVVGDPLYGGRPKKQLSGGPAERSLVLALLEQMPRQALHAAELELSHPVTGERLRFESPVPADFARALELLEAHAGNPRG
jgi:23S rRNA pseudouridine1911/1915/1917 synthase